MDFTMTHRFARISPTKVRPVARLVKDMPLNQALTILSLEKRRGAFFLRKVLRAAWANAQEKSSKKKAGAERYDEETFFVKNAHVDSAKTLRRIRARSMGRANTILKRSCHITVVLSDGQEAKA